jgi:A/G-specific adenine glycosylase
MTGNRGKCEAGEAGLRASAHKAEMSATEIDDLRRGLLAWYDLNRRDLPWRRTHDPYAIWVSEVMLQQTRVAAVIGRYEAFLRNFPSVQSLAHGAEADVLALWSGLGYYRRARMMHKAAKAVVHDHGGAMPRTLTGLRELPGVGVYTSAAIASIAYGEPVAVVDGNVERVVQRLAGWGSDQRSGQSELIRKTESLANMLLDPKRPGDFNQSMMELGATVCLPKNPMCLVCPLKRLCQTRGEHPTPKRAKMRSQDVAYALVIRSGQTRSGQTRSRQTARTGAARARSQGREVLLEQRASEQTVMPGMWELPSLRDTEVTGADLRMAVRHAIMQVNYYVRIRTVFEDDAEALTVPSDRRRWVRLNELGTLPLTGLARKVLLRAKLAELTPVEPLLESSLAAD